MQAGLAEEGARVSTLSAPKRIYIYARYRESRAGGGAR
jgi:hypothetical protein